MQLFQLFERTIKVPHEFTTDILRMSIYSIYLMHTRGGSEDDIATFTKCIEEVSGLDIKVLSMEFEGRIKRSVSAESDYVGLSALSVSDIPYYHSSSVIKDRLDSLPDSEVAFLIKILIRDSANSSYNDKNKSLNINVNQLSTSILRYWFEQNDKHRKAAINDIKKLESIIDHETQHIVQDLALHPKQSEIKSGYYSGDRNETDVHPDYFTSPAEIRPQLSNLAAEFKNLTDDEYWEYFSSSDRKKLFKMFVGIENTPFPVNIGGIDIEVSIPSKPYFNALKKDTPKQYLKVIKDFYNMVKDVF